MNDEEKEIMQCLVDAWQKYLKLEETHPSHNKDFSDGIHKCQDVLMHRIVQRDYPSDFPTYKKEKE